MNIFEQLVSESKSKVRVPRKKAPKTPVSKKVDVFAELAAETRASEARAKKPAPKPPGSQTRVSQGLLSDAYDIVSNVPSDLYVGAGESPTAGVFKDLPTEEEDVGIARGAVRSLGSLAADSPLMGAGGVAGGLTGAAIGGALGSVIPVVGTAFGAAVGAGIGTGAGTFAAPGFVSSATRAVKTPMPEEAGLSEYLGRVGDVAGETGKQAILGSMMSFAPFLGKYVSKAFPKALTKAAPKVTGELAKYASELGLLTGGRAAVEGELPTAKSVVHDALLVGALKGIHKGTEKISATKPVTTAKESVVSSAVKGLEKIGGKKASEFIRRKFWMKPEQKEFKKTIEKHFGERSAKEMENRFKYADELENLKKAGATEQNLEDSIFYREKTGNPNIKGDTHGELVRRTPKWLRDYTNERLDRFSDSMKERIKDNEYLKNINEREAVKEIFIPHFFEEPKTQKQREFLTSFRANHPFSNMRDFLTFHEAAEKTGLKPKYKNIVSLMKQYDNVITRAEANVSLIKDIQKAGKRNNKDLIVTSRSPNYEKLLATGDYVKFDDLNIRRYSPDGTMFGKPADKPALVEKNIAEMLKGVFKHKNVESTAFGRAWDNASNLIRKYRVQLSAFHAVALSESAAGSRGLKDLIYSRKTGELPKFGIRQIMEEGRALRSSKEAMVDMARHNLKVEGSVEDVTRGQKKEDAIVKWIADKIPDSIKDKAASNKLISKTMDKTKKLINYTFDQLHPNLKVTTYKNYTDEFLAKNPKATPEQIGDAKRQIASLVNNMYGGQNWNLTPILNDPRIRKWVARIPLAYSDWTTSAIKQAANIGAPGLKGKLSKQYWVRFVTNQALTTGIMKFIYGGLTQTDEDKSVSGVRFDPAKGLKEMVEGDPTKWTHIPLPDVPVKILGKEFNAGRGSRGQRLYVRFGKQMFEIFNWLKHPDVELYHKLNPVTQILAEQVLGSSIGVGKGWPVRGKYKGGQRLPWDATKPRTLENLFSRFKHVAGSVVPFSVRALFDKGGAAFLASGLASLPISEGASPSKVEDSLIEAFARKDTKSINRITKSLRDNNYKIATIKRTLTNAKKEARFKALKKVKS